MTQESAELPHRDDTLIASGEHLASFPNDPRLTRWSTVLMAMVAFAAFVNLAAPVYEFFFGFFGVVKDQGQKIWTTQFSALPLPDRFAVLAIASCDSAAWLYGLLQVGRLAQYYRRGYIFEERNAVCFIRLGVALGVLGLAQSAQYPLSVIYLYWRGITPWLADMPPSLFIIRPDFLMAGVFFYVLGKIMRRAKELEETNRLIV